MNLRLAHLADLHLGARLVDVPTKLVSFAEEAPYQAFNRASAAVRDGGYDGVIVAGDVFDRGEVSPRAFTAFLDALAQWHETGLRTVVIGGNHDAEATLPRRVRLPASVRWLSRDAAETVFWDDLGVAVHGQSIADRDDLRDLARGYPSAVPSLHNIGVLHTSLTGEESRRACAPTTLDGLQRHGYDYWALGHVHRRQVVSNAEAVAYSGSIYGRRAAETGAHGFFDVHLTGSSAALSPVDVAALRYETIALTAGAPIEDQLRKCFDALAAEPVVWSLPANAPAEAYEIARQLAARNERHAVWPRAVQPVKAT